MSFAVAGPTDASEVNLEEIDEDGFPTILKNGTWIPPSKQMREKVVESWMSFMNQNSFSSENLPDTLAFLYSAFIKKKNVKGLYFFLRHVFHKLSLKELEKGMYLSSILSLTIRFHYPFLTSEDLTSEDSLLPLLQTICDFGGQPYLIPPAAEFSAIHEALKKNAEFGGLWENVLLFLDDVYVPSKQEHKMAIDKETSLVLSTSGMMAKTAMHPSNLSYVKNFIEKRDMNAPHPLELLSLTIKHLCNDERFDWAIDKELILNCVEKLEEFIPWFIERTSKTGFDVNEFSTVLYGHTLLTYVLDGKWFDCYYDAFVGEEQLARPCREKVLKCVFDQLLSVENIDVLQEANARGTPAQIILENKNLLMRHKFILLMDLMNKNKNAAKNTGNLGVVLEKVRNLRETLKFEENRARLELEIPAILTIVLSFEGETIKLNTFKVPGFPGHVMGTPGPCALLEILQHLLDEDRIHERTVVQVDDADEDIDYYSMGFKRYNSIKPFKSEFWRLSMACSWFRDIYI